MHENGEDSAQHSNKTTHEGRSGEGLNRQDIIEDAELNRQGLSPKKSLISESNGRWTRRTFLKASAFGAAALSLLPSVGANERGTVEIVMMKHGNEPLKYAEAPKQWYEDLQIVKNIKYELTSKYFDLNGVFAVMLERSNKQIDGLHYLRPAVYVDPEQSLDTVKDTIPKSIDNVDINAKYSDRPQPASCPDFTPCSQSDLDGRIHNPSSTAYYGGIALLKDGGWVGTGGYPVKDENDDTRRLVAAAHSFNDNESVCDPINETAETDSYLNCLDIGDITDNIHPGDTAIITPNSTNIDKISKEVYKDTYSRQNVSGHYTHDGLLYLEAHGSIVDNFGATTGHKTGSIDAMGVHETGIDECADVVETFKVDGGLVGGGDSGSPIFRDPSGKDIRILGHLWGRRLPGDDEKCDGSRILSNEWWGVPAWRVADHGYIVGDGEIYEYW